MVSQQVTRGQFIGHDRRIHKDQELMDFGTHECAIFRERFFTKFYPLASAIKAEYLDIAKKSHADANRRLLELDDVLQVRNFNLLSDSEQVSDLADKLAAHCRNIAATSTVDNAYQSCSELAESYRLQPPTPQTVIDTKDASLARLCCEQWWKRNLMRIKKTTVEAITRELRQVHSHATPYCSSISLNQHRNQKRANREYLQSQLAVNELNQEYTLAELSDLGVSNPAIRRLELITRCKGYEILAKEFSHEALFITFTAPSRFHRMTKITGESGKTIKVVPNGKFDGSTPRDTQEYLCSTWAKIQSKFHREGIRPYGFRVAEPHHDGTPHWHFLLFVQRERTEELISIFNRWALKDSPDEKGASQHRVKVEKIKEGINPDTGREYSATGYIIKYISKNIDGHGVDNDEKAAQDKDWNGKDPIENAERIEAWARTNRIRQFQPIGGPSVTVWRELRRLSEQEGVVEDIRQAADSGDWAAFVKAMGGPNIPRDQYIARPTYALSEKLDFNSGEISQVTHTRYGDEARERVVGILIHGITVLSRTHFWQIRENEKVINARQKIMDGIADILEEVRDQNREFLAPPPNILSQQAKPAALDLFQ
ncbi:MAG: replication endonuclease [Thalassolituus sp.]|jgi:hypothetical protein